MFGTFFQASKMQIQAKGWPMHGSRLMLKWRSTFLSINPRTPGFFRDFGFFFAREKTCSAQKAALDFWVVVFYFHPDPWGNDPIWLIFFRWVETTNQTLWNGRCKPMLPFSFCWPSFWFGFVWVSMRAPPFGIPTERFKWESPGWGTFFWSQHLKSGFLLK